MIKPSYLIPIFLLPLGLLVPLAPRSGPLLVLLLGIVGIFNYVRQRPSLHWLRSPPVYFLGAFIGYLFLTSLWSITPERSLEQAFRLFVLALFGLATFSLVRSLNDAQTRRVTYCLVPALIVGTVGGCVFGLLQYTGGHIRIITDFLGFDSEFSNFSSNRLHIAKTMLVTNLTFFALLPWLWKKQKLIAIASFFALLTACIFSDSQSALLACLAGGLAFLMIKTSSQWALKVIMAGIVVSFALILPITQSSIMADLREVTKPTFLEKSTSTSLRLRIYEFFGDETLNRPILGHGLQAGIKFAAPNVDYRGIPAPVRTPHSVHLQTLFDLGYVGAILMLLALLTPVRQAYLNGNPELAAYLLLPICVTIAATSFNFVIWRTWIPSAAVLCLLFLFIQVRTPQTSKAD